MFYTLIRSLVKLERPLLSPLRRCNLAARNVWSRRGRVPTLQTLTKRARAGG
jgi:hypothetical protein